jgi:hypothetical protein
MLGFFSRWFGAITERFEEALQAGIHFLRGEYPEWAWQRSVERMREEWLARARDAVQTYTPLVNFARVRELFTADPGLHELGFREQWSARFVFADPQRGITFVDVALPMGEPWDFEKALRAAIAEGVDDMYPGDPMGSQKMRKGYVGYIPYVQRYVRL